MGFRCAADAAAEMRPGRRLEDGDIGDAKRERMGKEGMAKHYRRRGKRRRKETSRRFGYTYADSGQRRREL